VVGTPIYMSPEQAMGRVDDTDHRADQWALACIAWEMISGHPPFDGDSLDTLLHQITHADPSPLEAEVAALPPGVESVLRKALSKSVADRYSSIQEFARALETAAFGRCVEETPAPVRSPQQLLDEASRDHFAVADALDPVAEAGLPAGQGQEAGDEGARPSSPASVDVILTTDEVVARPVWRRPIVAVAVAAGLSMLLAASILLRSSRPVPVVPHTAQVGEIALPPRVGPVLVVTPPVASAIPLATELAQPEPRKRAKTEPARNPGAPTTAKTAPRGKAPKAQLRPKIFHQL